MIIFPGKFCTERMSPEEIEAQKVPLTERMVREPFWLGLITVLVVMIVIGVGYLVKKHLPEKIEKRGGTARSFKHRFKYIN